MQEEYVNITTKATKMYSLWTRPTIPWKLECEKNGNSRTSAIEKVNDMGVVVDTEKPFFASPQALSMAAGFSIAFLVIDVILSIVFATKVCNELDDHDDASKHCINTF